jgi:hypothetical protein
MQMLKRLYNLWKLSKYSPTTIVVNKNTKLLIHVNVGRIPSPKVTELCERTLSAFKEWFPAHDVMVVPYRDDGMGSVEIKTVQVLDNEPITV